MPDMPAVVTLIGCQIHQTEFPHQRLLRLVTAHGTLNVMADKKMLTEVGTAMLAVAAKMPDAADLQ